jgi:hypothetical protein
MSIRSLSVFRRAMPLLMVMALVHCVPAPAPAPAPAPKPEPDAQPAPPEPTAAPTAESQWVTEDPPALAGLRKDMPTDVSDFIRRAVVCNHWAGEEPYDDDRRAQINAAVSSLRCRELDADQATLRKQYAGQNEILRRINQSRRTPL